MQFLQVACFDEWRAAARTLLCNEVHPSEVHWAQDDKSPGLFDDFSQVEHAQKEDADQDTRTHTMRFNVPSAFLDLARTVACHRNPSRWQLLYQTLWRVVHGERHVLELDTDDDVHQLQRMKKAVTRDVHKMKAFVRFRKIEAGNLPEIYLAWHRPDHLIMRLAAPFFARRFKGMSWTIFTPHESAHWDQKLLTYGPGIPASQAPPPDEQEELWKTYYASIFNPARIKLDMMKREMPVRHWRTLPEADLIEDLVRDAPARVKVMIDNHEGFSETGVHYLPEQRDLSSLRKAVGQCQACELCHDATQAVFGVGPANASVVLVGEQPGDREDVTGTPFVGPAGQLLNAALFQAGIDRTSVYLTNVVKHFKHEQRGKRRLHKKPDSREIYACRPWLEAEISALKPKMVICLGVTAAQALMGRDFRLTQQRGVVHKTQWSTRTLATWHPAAILRMQNVQRKREMESQLIEDLRQGMETTR